MQSSPSRGSTIGTTKGLAIKRSSLNGGDRELPCRRGELTVLELLGCEMHTGSSRRERRSLTRDDDFQFAATWVDGDLERFADLPQRKDVSDQIARVNAAGADHVQDDLSVARIV